MATTGGSGAEPGTTCRPSTPPVQGPPLRPSLWPARTVAGPAIIADMARRDVPALQSKPSSHSCRPTSSQDRWTPFSTSAAGGPDSRKRDEVEHLNTPLDPEPVRAPTRRDPTEALDKRSAAVPVGPSSSLQASPP